VDSTEIVINLLNLLEMLGIRSSLHERITVNSSESYIYDFLSRMGSDDRDDL
jgi:hypothetical protein